MRLLLPVLLLCLGCKPVDPAPEDLDGLEHYAWRHLDDGSDAEMLLAVEGLHAAIGTELAAEYDDFAVVMEGEVSHLTFDEVANLPTGDQDPAEATGVLLVDWIGCTLPELEAILANPDQDELYVGVYDAYERSNTTSAEDFLSGATDWLSWDLDYATSVLGAGYSVRSETLVRRITEVQLEGGPSLSLRVDLREPAVFDNPDSNAFLEQDYHLEVYWPHQGGLLHTYALWKDTRMLGFEDESETTQRVVINSLGDWDEHTTALCRERRRR